MEGKEIYHFWYFEGRYYINCPTKSGWMIKSILFNKLDEECLINLALFDYLPEEKTWSDTNRSQPNKLSVLFFTISEIVLDFFNNHPEAIVSFQGNTQSKSRLYSIFISHHLDFIADKFQVLGETENEIERFQANKKYLTILILRK